MKRLGWLALPLILAACVASKEIQVDRAKFNAAPEDGGKFYSFKVKDIDGNDVNLSDFKGKVLLVVNVASKCGHTPEYKGMEEAYQKYHDQGFEVLGFPANNFFHQEPGTNAEIKEFCSLTYGVKFPMFAKISVKGDDMNPLYTYLTTQTEFPGDIRWNFDKFLINRQGRVVARFSPGTKVETKQVINSIETLLKEK